MHYPLAFLLPVALAARTSSWKQDNYDWAFFPERTADYYTSNNLPLPDVVPEQYDVKSEVPRIDTHIIKLQCLGCPFRVRKYLEVTETWQEPPSDNSLMLNITIQETEPAILLNGYTIWPLADPPAPVTAFQLPTNSSTEILDHIVDTHMLDDSFNMGTRFGEFELQYKHTLLGTKQPDLFYVLLDVTGIHMRQSHNPGSYDLAMPDQKMIEILLQRSIEEDTLKESIAARSITVLKRDQVPQPLKMACGKDAKIETEYNPLEWDRFGKFGTWSRTWHKFAWDASNQFERMAPNFLVVAVVFCLIRIIKRRQAAALRAQEEIVDIEAEAALLEDEDEDEDEIPEYFKDFFPVEEKEEGQ